MAINTNFEKLAEGYLFPVVARKTKEFEVRTGIKALRLGIGDTTEPLTPTVIAGLHLGVEKLANVDTYTGYGDEQGDARLRKAIAERYARAGISIDPLEVFVSDGAKPDSANIQSIFSLDDRIAVQDPAYPVYVDSNVIAGRTGTFKDGRYEGIFYMPCTKQNDFIPRLPSPQANIIYLCSPNNPTGAVMIKEWLRTFVDFARSSEAVIIFDAAYSAYMTDPSLPRSIYEIEGAKECAIEINSFSKDTGFTGVRLGWTVVPMDAVTKGSKPGKLNALWSRRQTTEFNGPSNIVQEGGIAALSEQGQKECQGLVDYYMANAKIIKEGMEGMDMACFGGINAPYIWMKTPNGMKSWDFFDKLLNEAQVVCTPGVGFGPSGEGYVRLSAFGHKENVEAAVQSIKQNLRL